MNVVLYWHIPGNKTDFVSTGDLNHKSVSALVECSMQVGPSACVWMVPGTYEEEA